MDTDAADANHTDIEAPAEDSGKAQGASVVASIFSMTNTIIGAGKLLLLAHAPQAGPPGDWRMADGAWPGWPELRLCLTRRAGIMALPRAVATMGAVPGALLIIFTYVVSFITMDVLSRCSTAPRIMLNT